MTKFLKILPFLVVCTVSIILVMQINKNGSIKDNSLFEKSPLIGHSLPEIIGEDLFSPQNQINLTDNNKYLLINFFASWCSTCLEEHKQFNLIDNKSKKLALIGIAWRDEKNDSVNWLMQNGNPFEKVIYDNTGKIGINLGIKGLPETLLVSPDKKILLHYRGNINQEFLEKVREIITNN
jgi:cytochrome c biogenesis protein CcmG/thiol:disulfide interchange protein DsbE